MERARDSGDICAGLDLLHVAESGDTCRTGRSEISDPRGCLHGVGEAGDGSAQLHGFNPYFFNPLQVSLNAPKV